MDAIDLIIILLAICMGVTMIFLMRTLDRLSAILRLVTKHGSTELMEEVVKVMKR